MSDTVPIEGHIKTPVADALEKLVETLITYSNPDYYAAISFYVDKPAGEFADDFDMVPDSMYDRPMPGKLARKVLDEIFPQRTGSELEGVVVSLVKEVLSEVTRVMKEADKDYRENVSFNGSEAGLFQFEYALEKHFGKELMGT